MLKNRSESKPVSANLWVWLVVVFFSGVMGLMVLSQPDLKHQVERPVEHFLVDLQAQDAGQLTQAFSQNLAARLSPQQVLTLFETWELMPMPHWELIHSDFWVKKKQAVVHAQTATALLRFDLSLPRGILTMPAGKIKINNFCLVDQALQNTALNFMQQLQAGDISAAYAQTVDAASPRRQGQQFSPERLQQLHQSLKDLPPLLAGERRLHEGYVYQQNVSSGTQHWRLSLHHWDYTPSGCRFFVFDLTKV